MLNVSVPSIKRAREVIDNGAPELVQAVERPCLNSRPFADSSLIVFGYRHSGNDGKDDHLNKAQGEFFLRMGKDAV